MTLYGYARVSTHDQDFTLQEQALRAAGCEVIRAEKVTEAAYQIGDKPVSYNIVESVLSRQIDDLEPTLTRNGYRLKDLTEQFDAKPAEIKALFSNTLESTRTAELRDKMLRAGLPI